LEDEQEAWQVVNEALSVYKELLINLDEESKESLVSLMKFTALEIVDQYWTEHLDHLQNLIEGIHLRQYQQEDPIRLYEFDGFKLFETTFYHIQREISVNLASTFQDL
ncbi:accessory Sec system translocase SecA2, partial [Bacillus velezensis]